MSTTKHNARNVLGRGLTALLEDANTHHIPSDIAKNFSIIPIESITTNPFQPRKDFDQDALDELSESIKVHGLIQPLTVRKINNESDQLIAGERRLRAAKQINLKSVPVYIRHTDNQAMIELALIENIQRESLNAIEIAISYQQLLAECNLTQENLAHRIGKNRTTINNYLRLLKLPEAIQVAVRDQKISMGHARALINIDSKDAQLDILKQIIDKSLSVRQTERLAKIALKTDNKTLKKQALQPAIDEKIRDTITQFGSKLNTKVYIKANPNYQGEIKIVFNTKRELDRIIEHML